MLMKFFGWVFLFNLTVIVKAEVRTQDFVYACVAHSLGQAPVISRGMDFDKTRNLAVSDCTEKAGGDFFCSSLNQKSKTCEQDQLNPHLTDDIEYRVFQKKKETTIEPINARSGYSCWIDHKNKDDQFKKYVSYAPTSIEADAHVKGICFDDIKSFTFCQVTDCRKIATVESPVKVQTSTPGPEAPKKPQYDHLRRLRSLFR